MLAVLSTIRTVPPAGSRYTSGAVPSRTGLGGTGFCIVTGSERFCSTGGGGVP
jgi:hypothetical protein